MLFRNYCSILASLLDLHSQTSSVSQMKKPRVREAEDRHRRACGLNVGLECRVSWLLLPVFHPLTISLAEGGPVSKGGVWPSLQIPSGASLGQLLAAWQMGQGGPPQA